MSGVLVPVALAGRFSVSPLQPQQGVGGKCHAVAVLRVRSPNLGHGRNRFPRYAEAIEDVVPGNVVGDQPEERSQRAGLAASAWAG